MDMFSFFPELVIFYNTRNLHKKALLLLMKYSKEPDSDIAGNQRIIAYLQASSHIHFFTALSVS
jgi:hypothetical protein